MNDYVIKNINYDEMNKALELVRDVFMEFDAPDYSDEGIQEFTENIIKNPEYTNKFKTGEYIMIGAYTNDNLIGVLAISIRNHISLLFVDKNYHRKGIGTLLFNEIIRRLNLVKAKKITLNASPYAVPFYQKLGFTATDSEHVTNGIKYTPMEYIF